MGIQFKYVMVCDSESHAYHRNDPDKGVDMPIILKENIVNHSITRDVEKFAIIWGCSLKINYPFKALAFTTENGGGEIQIHYGWKTLAIGTALTMILEL